MKRLTDTQKESIRGLRAEGFGYKAIAEQLRLSRETVRSFCTRNNVLKGTDGNIETAEQTNEEVCQSGQGALRKSSDATSEIKSGNTVFIISTRYSENATNTLEQKLKTLILNASSKEAEGY